MGLKGKLLGQIEISFHGDLFHEILGARPHHLPSMTSVIHEVGGQWGTQGCTTKYKYTQLTKDYKKAGIQTCDLIIICGKTETEEAVMDIIDNEKKIVKYRIVKGDVLKSYKSFIVTCEVETNGDDKFVTWTVVYEKLKEEIPEPLTYMEYFFTVTKDLDNHHAKPNP
ncbi:kirola-like [Ipomoea triloba]|uniref:kirola-like n=1 Tax=Ipomoea triloba TaxID=35885 RepID=UPI00125DAAA5|nr:kirola-like [Ipomoea triloba]